RGAANEGDVGVIDAIHENDRTYTVGFYAAEDCLIDSCVYHEDEIRPFEGSHLHGPYEVGERVKTLEEKYTFPKGTIGEVVSVYTETQAVAVKVLNDKKEEAILPYGYNEVSKLL
ncbi:MAG: hypothetical protein V3G53_04900, partial [Candidatus Enteromonas sp.]